YVAGLLLGRFLRSDEPRADVDVVFEPEGDWGMEGGPFGNGGSGASGARRTYESATEPGLTEENPLAASGARDAREMTPDLENVSDEHPSIPAPLGREGTRGETPVRTPVAGHETAGPGIRTG